LRLSKIYTKIGDKGTTMLADGSTIPKNSERIECYGHVDELNSFVGLLRDTISEMQAPKLDRVNELLKKVQNELFDLGGELATPAEVLNIEQQQVVTKASIARLESEIDTMNESLPPLENFVLPGGNKANSLAHICRTICRRAERACVTLSHITELRSEPRIYLNRLSDWFFVISRFISSSLNIDEVLWDQNKKK